MHEYALIVDLLRKLHSIAREQQAAKIVSVTIKVGALAHLSPQHLRETFPLMARGSVVEGARLEIQVLTDVTDPQAHAVWLDSVEVRG